MMLETNSVYSHFENRGNRCPTPPAQTQNIQLQFLFDFAGLGTGTHWARCHAKYRNQHAYVWVLNVVTMVLDFVQWKITK